MLGWGIVIFLGLAFIFWDMNPVTRAKILAQPMLIHEVVVGSGLLIHGGSALCAMAAIASGLFSALFVRFMRYTCGYISKGQWHAGTLRPYDPRKALA